MMGQILFVIFALMVCGGAIGVVLSQNVVRMAFWLVISLTSTAFLYFLLGADFVGATQLLIYVGGTVVVLVFGVMLTSSGPGKFIPSSPGELVQSGIVAIAFLAIVSSTVLAVNWTGNAKILANHEQAAQGAEEEQLVRGYNPESYGNTTRSLGTALLGVRFDKDLGAGTADSETKLSTGYLLPFEIVSVHLLVVLIGAAYLARAKRRVSVQNG